MRILQILALLALGGIIDAHASDNTVPRSTILVGAWTGQIGSDKIELAIWYEADNPFFPHQPGNPMFTGFIRKNNGDCAAYLSGQPAPANAALGNDIGDLVAERRAFLFTNRNMSGDDVKACGKLSGLYLIVTPGELAKIEFRSLTPGVANNVFVRTGASTKLAAASAAGRPALAARSISHSVPAASELAVIKGAQTPAALLGNVPASCAVKANEVIGASRQQKIWKVEATATPEGDYDYTANFYSADGGASYEQQRRRVSAGNPSLAQTFSFEAKKADPADCNLMDTLYSYFSAKDAGAFDDSSLSTRMVALAQPTPTKASAARQNASAKKAKEPCAFCDLPGGEYLQAIYAGNYELQDRLAWNYLLDLRKAKGDTLALGVIMGGVAKMLGTGRERVQDLTVLEESLSTYMSMFSKYGKQCLQPGSFERKFAHTDPDDVVYDENFLEVSRLPGETTYTVFKLNKKFQPACDRLCNAGGMMAFSSMAGDQDKDAHPELGYVFKGIIAMLKQGNCSRPEVTRFEDNLLAMYVKEQQEQADSRNTLKNALYAQ